MKHFCGSPPAHPVPRRAVREPWTALTLPQKRLRDNQTPLAEKDGFPRFGDSLYGGGASEGGIQRGKPRRGRSGTGCAFLQVDYLGGFALASLSRNSFWGQVFHCSILRGCATRRLLRSSTVSCGNHCLFPVNSPLTLRVHSFYAPSPRPLLTLAPSLKISSPQKKCFALLSIRYFPYVTFHTLL